MGRNATLFSQCNEVLQTANTAPIAVTIMGVALVLIASLVWRRRKEGKLGEIRKIHSSRAVLAQWITGIVLALMASYFMFDGHILGEETTGISTVMGTVGICLIGASNATYYVSKPDKKDRRTGRKSPHETAFSSSLAVMHVLGVPTYRCLAHMLIEMQNWLLQLSLYPHNPAALPLLHKTILETS